MHAQTTTTALLISALAATTTAHGVVTSISGANGVTMPGLTIADGTPRDCSSNRCGSQADTAIIRDREIRSGEVGPLGRTQGNGPVRAETMISNFMGTGTAPENDGAEDSVGVEDDVSAAATGGRRGRNRGNNAKRASNTNNSWLSVRQLRDFLSGLTGGRGGGGDKGDLPDESSVAATAGDGESSGLPTCDDDGTITMTFRQINQDGAGPMSAAVDGTSGGEDEDAFQTAEVTEDVPGFGVQGLSLATNTDFEMKVQMPDGMTCDATVAGVDNVCVVRVRNGAAAGPFGGSAAFTQSPDARKRAVAWRIKKRQEFGNMQ